MGMVEEEEIRIVHDKPKDVRGEKSYRKCGFEISRNVLSSLTSFQVAPRLEVKHWIGEE